MATKTKATGFTRLLLVLIFAAPLAYIGASYYNGEDGLQNIKNLVGMGEQTERTIEANTNEATTTIDNSAIEKLEKDIEYKDRRIKELKEELSTKDQEIENLKQQIKSLDSNE